VLGRRQAGIQGIGLGHRTPKTKVCNVKRIVECLCLGIIVLIAPTRLAQAEEWVPLERHGSDVLYFNPGATRFLNGYIRGWFLLEYPDPKSLAARFPS
jgi:hypothetical protein